MRRKYKLITAKLHWMKEPIKKVMVCEINENQVHVFLYTVEYDWFNDHSEFFNSLEEAESYCNCLGIDNLGWVEIDGCLEYCNLDWIAPVRSKGRNIGEPQCGIYEKFDGAKWVEFKVLPSENESSNY